MPLFRVERTELHTRVWQIEAKDADDARERYLDEEDIEEYGYHEGHPTVVVKIVERATSSPLRKPPVYRQASNMLTITIKDPAGPKFYRARVTRGWAERHDNGALVSLGLTVDEVSSGGTVHLTRRSFNLLLTVGRVEEITHDDYRHSSCQSNCVRRGDATCAW